MTRTYDVYCPVERDGVERWVKVGHGLLHRSGKGINIYLDALPLDGRLALFPEGVPPPQETSGG